MRRTIAIMLFFFLFTVSLYSYAYFEDYPPHKFEEGPHSRLEIEPIVGYGSDASQEFIADDGKIQVIMKGHEAGVFFGIKDECNTLVEEMDINMVIPRPWYVYWADISNNGLNDFIVISEYMGNGLAAHNQRVDLYLKKEDGTYAHVRYETLSTGLSDFVDLDGDGKYEIIITGMCSGEYKGRAHNYFFYNIYAIENYELVNADDRFEGFPKFIWYTNDPNDKDTVHLSQEERQEHTSAKNASIEYPRVSYDRLELITDKILSGELDDKTQASLLVEKAKIQIVIGPRTSTSLVLSAIKLDPDNAEYRAYLAELYDVYWKDMDMNKDNYEAEGMYEDFVSIKEAAEEILKLEQGQ